METHSSPPARLSFFTRLSSLLFLEIPFEQVKRTLPRVLGVFGAINVGARVVEESVRAARIGFYFARFVEPFEGAGQPVDVFALNPSVVLAVGIKHRTVHTLQLLV